MFNARTINFVALAGVLFTTLNENLRLFYYRSWDCSLFVIKILSKNEPRVLINLFL